MIYIILLTILLLGLCFIGIAIKIILKKNGQFSGTCSSNNILLKNEDGSCEFCGTKNKNNCKNKENINF